MEKTPGSPKNRGRKEFSTISRGVQTWEADHHRIEDQYFREAITPELQVIGESSEELNVTECVIEPNQQASGSGYSDIFKIQSHKPEAEVVEPTNIETTGGEVLESGTSTENRFRTLNPSDNLVDTIPLAEAGNIAVRLQQLASKGPPKGYQHRERPPTLIRGKEKEVYLWLL